ncbi:trimeric intracellular cation channel family protein [soil metagenome]
MDTSVAHPGTVLVVLDLVGIFVFAINGALVAVRKELDVFAVLVLAGTTGLGGGFLRDVLIGAAPPAALADWRYLLVPAAAGLVTFFFHPSIGRAERVINVLDAAGLALFCVTGALKAVAFGLGPVPAALMGMLTGIGGGMIRDVLSGRVPLVFRGDLYATPALVGAFIAVLGHEAGLRTAVVAVPAAAVCFVWRVVAMRRGWNAPRASASSST